MYIVTARMPIMAAGFLHSAGGNLPISRRGRSVYNIVQLTRNIHHQPMGGPCLRDTCCAKMVNYRERKREREREVQTESIASQHRNIFHVAEVRSSPGFHHRQVKQRSRETQGQHFSSLQALPESVEKFWNNSTFSISHLAGTHCRKATL